jgi:L-2,4-diaminobutyrate transaminase
MFAHGFTWSGHPVGAAIANANLDIMESERLPDHAAQVGSYLIEQLRRVTANKPYVGEVRGKGLLIAVELDADPSLRRPFADFRRVSGILGRACFEERLLIRGGHDRVMAALAPPLIATKEDADDIAGRLARALDRTAAQIGALGLAE